MVPYILFVAIWTSILDVSLIILMRQRSGEIYKGGQLSKRPSKSSSSKITYVKKQIHPGSEVVEAPLVTPSTTSSLQTPTHQQPLTPISLP
jgi:hypothetical protein